MKCNMSSLLKKLKLSATELPRQVPPILPLHKRSSFEMERNESTQGVASRAVRYSPNCLGLLYSSPVEFLPASLGMDGFPFSPPDR